MGYSEGSLQQAIKASFHCRASAAETSAERAPIGRCSAGGKPTVWPAHRNKVPSAWSQWVQMLLKIGLISLGYLNTHLCWVIKGYTLFLWPVGEVWVEGDVSVLPTLSGCKTWLTL